MDRGGEAETHGGKLRVDGRLEGSGVGQEVESDLDDDDIDDDRLAHDQDIYVIVSPSTATAPATLKWAVGPNIGSELIIDGFGAAPAATGHLAGNGAGKKEQRLAFVTAVVDYMVPMYVSQKNFDGVSQSQVSAFKTGKVSNAPSMKTVTAVHANLLRVASGVLAVRPATENKKRTSYVGEGHDTRVTLASFIDTSKDPEAFEPGSEVTDLLNTYRGNVGLEPLNLKQVKTLNTKLKRDRRNGCKGTAWATVKRLKTSNGKENVENERL